MKKVMMIAYYYPPKLNIGGLRTTRFEKYLPQFGWTPIIHTVRDGKYKKKANVYHSLYIKLKCIANILTSIIELLFKICRIRLTYKNIANEFIIIPDSNIGWIIPCFLKSIIINIKYNYDLIYVSCKPFSAAITGVLIKKFLGKKLIIDYRDHFALNINKKHTNFHKKITIRLEKFFLKNCDYMITSTKGMEMIYRKHYPDLKINTIYNGFDFIPKHQYKKNNKMVISHTGYFYLNRTPDLILKAIKSLELKDIIFQTVGLGEDRFIIIDCVEKYKVYDQVKILRDVPHNIALQIQQKSDVLFLSQIYSKGKNVQIAAKTYEYLASGRPIIADLPEGDNAELIKKYSKNSYVIPDKDLEKMKSALLHLYHKWQKDELKTERNPEFLQKFSGAYLTRQLSEVFNEVISSKETN